MNKTINQLDEIASAELTDEAVIFDLSDSDTKKMTMQKAFNAMHKLSSTSVADSADELALYDSANNVTKKITKQNLLSEIQPPIIASSATINGPAVEEGLYIKVIFTSAISASDTVTPLEINYNGDSVPVKVIKAGVASDILAHEISSGVYSYLQAMVNFEMVYSSAETAFILVGNPIVLSSTDYTIYADGQIVYAKENVLETAENIFTEFISHTSSSNPYVCPYDGYIDLTTNSHCYIASEETNASYFCAVSGGGTGGASFYVSKGLKLWVQTQQGSSIWARWYKNRDYSNR